MEIILRTRPLGNKKHESLNSDIELRYFGPLQLRKAMIDTAPITAQPPKSSNPSSQAFEVYDLSFDEVCHITPE